MLSVFFSTNAIAASKLTDSAHIRIMNCTFVQTYFGSYVELDRKNVNYIPWAKCISTPNLKCILFFLISKKGNTIFMENNKRFNSSTVHRNPITRFDTFKIRSSMHLTSVYKKN